MKINKIKLNNFRIYKGINEISLSPSTKNINIIAGKNGFGKTTFLTSLIWCFYGKMMGEVEEKYRIDIKNAGGYEKYLETLINREVKYEYDNQLIASDIFSVELELVDIIVPSIPCKSVLIRRSYNIKTEKESLDIYIDGLENELAKEVGLDMFINDFILPREIAKFFFFDAEKIVSLAEAKSKSELRNLSKAYSEVLGIKKYEDLKKNLESLQSRLRRNGASDKQKEKLEELIQKEKELESLLELNKDKRASIDKELNSHRELSDSLQEKLIREGNGITLEELQALKKERDILKDESTHIRHELKKLLDISPLVIAGTKFIEFFNQLKKEKDSNEANLDLVQVINEINSFSKILLKQIKSSDLDNDNQIKFQELIKKTTSKTISTRSGVSDQSTKVLLDYTLEQFRAIEAVYNNMKTTFSQQFSKVVQDDKNNRIFASRVYQQIRKAEARKDNPLATQLREDKQEADSHIGELLLKKGKLTEEDENLSIQLNSVKKLVSEYEKNFKLIEADQKKYEVTNELLVKINQIIQKIKQEKKYSLQKSIALELKKIMHKDNFIHSIKVNVSDDIMDIDLLDQNNKVIDKNSLSKGEQQLYATALLKALVDESGIQFPVFIDSPLQKFDKSHSKNIIREFYPSISEQVVLFPLLEKELSEEEYEYLKPNVNRVYLIDNRNNSSSLKLANKNTLFETLRKENHVHTN